MKLSYKILYNISIISIKPRLLKLKKSNIKTKKTKGEKLIAS